MTDLDRLALLFEKAHEDNQHRFAALEKRLDIIETNFTTGIAIFKWVGSAGIVVLILQLVAHWV